MNKRLKKRMSVVAQVNDKVALAKAEEQIEALKDKVVAYMNSAYMYKAENGDLRVRCEEVEEMLRQEESKLEIANMKLIEGKRQKAEEQRKKMAKRKPSLRRTRPKYKILKAENAELRKSCNHLIKQTVKQLADIEELKDENRAYNNEIEVLKADCSRFEEVIGCYKKTLTEQYNANKSMIEKNKSLTELVAREREINKELKSQLEESSKPWYKKLFRGGQANECN